MAKPERFVLVCVNQRPEGHFRGSCAQKGGRDILMKFAETLEAEGLLGQVSLVQTGCLGPCMEGPVVAVFPDNHWYGNLRPGDVETIVAEHLKGGEPVARLSIKDEDWD